MIALLAPVFLITVIIPVSPIALPYCLDGPGCPWFPDCNDCPENLDSPCFLNFSDCPDCPDYPDCPDKPDSLECPFFSSCPEYLIYLFPGFSEYPSFHNCLNNLVCACFLNSPDCFNCPDGGNFLVCPDYPCFPDCLDSHDIKHLLDCPDSPD